MNTISCINCGRNYPNPIQVVNSTNVTINNPVSVCPYCAGVNTYASGTFDYDEQGNAIKSIFEKVSLSPTEVLAIRELLTSNSIKNSNSVEVAGKIAEINPGLSGLKAISSYFEEYKGLIAFVALILSAITFYYKVIKPSEPSTIINNYNITYPEANPEPIKSDRGSNFTQKKKKRKK